MTWIRRPLLRLVLVAVVLGTAVTVSAQSGAPVPSVAFHYAANPPLAELKAFDIAVIEPDHVPDPKPHRREAAVGASELYAYVSLGEVLPSRAYYKEIPAGILKGENRDWGSSVVDQAHPAWPAFFIERIVAPLWQRGYRGFFLDTLDSYHLIAKTPEARAVQEAAMVATLRALKLRYPQIRLIFNRGFEILPQVNAMVQAVAAESMFRGYDAGRKVYREVPAPDRDWLRGQLDRVKNEYRLQVIAIDYLPPAQRELARDTAKKIAALGYTPWVANPELDMLGVGAREVQPRRVLVLTEKAEPENDFHYAVAQRQIGMPLNHLGYTYELLDPRSMALPPGTLRGRYAGIVSWLDQAAGARDDKAVADFILRHVADGVRVAVFNQLPFALDAARARALGLDVFAVNSAPASVRIVHRDPIVGFETEALPNRSALTPVRLREGSGQALLRLADSAGRVYDAAAVTPWGGYAFAPFASVYLAAIDQDRWVINPLAFLQAALGAAALPVPDATTEAGRRMLLVHVDGDGWASRAEMPGAPYASEVMAKEILERFRVPTMVSVIEGETSAGGVFASQSAKLEAIARRIYQLPHVEAASHTYSHPFNWRLASAAATLPPAAAGEVAYAMRIPGYRFDLAREIGGSVDYINRSLLPVGKRARVLLWSGNCVPTPEALGTAYASGLLNMNGGDTTITRETPTWTRIAPQGIRKATGYQVFAPNQNENVYTRDWTGPFYGFERAIETFEMTEKPHRFKPINIYFHTYSASKPASLNALTKVFQYALAQPVTPVYASDYIAKVLDFEGMALARDLITGDLLVRGDGALRTLRLPADASTPDLAASRNVAGITAGPGPRYLTLTASEARVALVPATAAVAHLVEANGTLSDFTRDQEGFGFSLLAHVKPMFRLANSAACTVTVNGRAHRATVVAANTQRHDLDPQASGREPYRQVVRVRCVQ